MPKFRQLPRWIDAVYVLCLAVYILAGMDLVPFHGDESTVIYTARDFYYIAVQGDMRHVLYSTNPEDISPDAATEQHLRLLNGTLTRYLYGLTAYSAGYSVEQINGQWDWCCDWNYNRQAGHIPEEHILLRTRTVSTLLLIASLVVMFVLAYQVGGRGTAYLATLYYALNPALLVNVRRAMMEGGMMLFMLLVLLAGMYVIRSMQQAAPPGKVQPGRYVLLGVVAGLALASKHTAVFALVAVFGACFLYAIWQVWRTRHPAYIRHLIALIGAGCLALLVFYALNPAWWGDPLARANLVLHLRTELLNGQTATFGGYPDFSAQAAGFLRQVFVIPPQYYEVANWQEFIGWQIAEYEACVLHGVSIGGSLPGAALLSFLTIIGCITILRNRMLPGGVRWLIAVYALVMLALTLLLTPLEWQRYYLPAYPVVALFAAAGVVTVTQRIASSVRQTVNPTTP